MSDEAEQQLVLWMQQESRAREVRRLRASLARLEQLQLASYGMIGFWVAAMFAGYQLWPERVPAELASIVTVWAFFGGGLIVWHLVRLKRAARRQLEAELSAQAQDL